jgi:hypothetical protein
MKYLVCLLLLASAALATAKCAARGKVSVASPGNIYRLDLDPTGSYKIASIASGKVVSKGKLDVVGHHYEVWISDRGDRIALVDPYAGYALYDSKGKTLESGDAGHFLTEKERIANPHKWPCHPEGEWLKHANFGENELVLTVHNQRVIRVPVRLART